MKVYALRYRQEDDVQPPKRPYDPIEDVDVQYSKQPDWKITLRELAAPELRILRNMRVHVGSHYCEFSIEELPDGAFAIFCLSHPELAPTTHGAAEVSRR